MHVENMPDIFGYCEWRPLQGEAECRLLRGDMRLDFANLLTLRDVSVAGALQTTGVGNLRAVYSQTHASASAVPHFGSKQVVVGIILP